MRAKTIEFGNMRLELTDGVIGTRVTISNIELNTLIGSMYADKKME